MTTLHIVVTEYPSGELEYPSVDGAFLSMEKAQARASYRASAIQKKLLEDDDINTEIVERENGFDVDDDGDFLYCIRIHEVPLEDGTALPALTNADRIAQEQDVTRVYLALTGYAEDCIGDDEAEQAALDKAWHRVSTRIAR